MGLKPLGIVREIVEAAGMTISYVYEDLVFIDHNAFLLQFTDADKVVLLHFNREAGGEELAAAIFRLKKESMAREILLRDGDTYTLRQAEGEQIRLEFLPSG